MTNRDLSGEENINDLIGLLRPPHAIMMLVLAGAPADSVIDYLLEDVRSPNAYETLLWDVMKNDATLFMRADTVEAAWQLLAPVLEAWAMAPPSDFPNYAAGTWGPEGAQGLLAHRHNWPLPTNLAWLPKTKGKNS